MNIRHCKRFVSVFFVPVAIFLHKTSGPFLQILIKSLITLMSLGRFFLPKVSMKTYLISLFISQKTPRIFFPKNVVFQSVAWIKKINPIHLFILNCNMSIKSFTQINFYNFFSITSQHSKLITSSSPNIFVFKSTSSFDIQDVQKAFIFI